MIQIDMEMPKCCDECFALDDHGDYPFCLISQDQRGYTFNVRKRRMPTCPLKAQAPRVMALEEMQKIASIRDGAIWLEAGAGLMPAFMEFATKDITFFVAVPLTGYRQFFENDWYGKTWRCWTSRPTNEQREAAPWTTGQD